MYTKMGETNNQIFWDEYPFGPLLCATRTPQQYSKDNHHHAIHTKKIKRIKNTKGRNAYARSVLFIQKPTVSIFFYDGLSMMCSKRDCVTYNGGRTIQIFHFVLATHTH